MINACRVACEMEFAARLSFYRGIPSPPPKGMLISERFWGICNYMGYKTHRFAALGAKSPN